MPCYPRAGLALLALCAILPGQSRISLQSAAARAHTSHEPDPTVRNPDWLADPLLGPDEVAMLDNHPIARAVNQDYRIANLDPDVVALSRAVLVRTRFIDERFQRALRGGVTQVVILNAGFDTRPYRFRPLLAGKRVFEIDDAATQTLKKGRLLEVLGALPPYVTYTASLEAVLASPQYDKTARTFFIWEGAPEHTAEAQVRDTLRAIAHAAPGSLLVMDFVWQSLLEKINQDPMAPQARWDRGIYGEPVQSGVPDGASEPYFRGLGLVPVETLDTNSREAEKRYLTRRDGSAFGPLPNAPGNGLEHWLGVVCVELSVPAAVEGK
jgi:methyltransferase (TIGR00027 family)